MTKDQLYAEWCRSRGVSLEAEEEARQAFVEAVGYEPGREAPEGAEPPLAQPDQATETSEEEDAACLLADSLLADD